MLSVLKPWHMHMENVISTLRKKYCIVVFGPRQHASVVSTMTLKITMGQFNFSQSGSYPSSSAFYWTCIPITVSTAHISARSGHMNKLVLY